MRESKVNTQHLQIKRSHLGFPNSTERQIEEGLAIERESREVDNLLNGKGEWGINIVPRLQTEKDRLGKIEENQALTSSTNGKRQAEFRENQPTETHNF